jgi:hypothetical protein
MKTSNVTGFLFLLAICGGCVDDADLHRSIFIRDKLHPDLPQYSEWGYNTFGAYINDEVFVSWDYYWDPAIISPSDTTVLLSLHGERRSKNKDTTDMILYFIIPHYAPRDAHYLLELNDAVIDLKSSSSQVLIMSDTTLYPVTINKGELHFTRVQNLFVDNNPEETILSGTFEFQGIMNGNPVNVTLGRFDVGVNYYYNY